MGIFYHAKENRLGDLQSVNHLPGLLTAPNSRALDDFPVAQQFLRVFFFFLFNLTAARWLKIAQLLLKKVEPLFET